MEVQVTDTFGLDEDVLVSIRYGTVRRQAPLESVKSHPFKFPAQLDDLSEPLKIDLLKPVASTRLVLHPKEEHYSIGFEQEDSIAMGLHVMAGSLEAETNSGGGKEAGAKDSASSAKDYLEQKGLLKYVQSLLHAVIQDKPMDPFSYMIEQLTAAQSKSMACERVMSRPTSAAMSRPTSAAVQRPQGNRPASARPTPPKQKQVAQAPAPSEDPPAFPAEPISPPAKEERPPMRQIPEQQPPAKDPRHEEALQKLDERAQAKNDLMQKLLSAAESGNLGAVLSSIGLDQSRQRIQALLEQSAETGDLEAALKLAMNQKELDEVLRLKTEMRTVLQGASETGEMQTVLDEIAGEQRSQRVQSELRDVLFEASDSGKMAEVLEEIAGEQRSQRVQSELRDVLFEANGSGKMAEVLEEIAGEQRSQRVQSELRDVLFEANGSGKMAEVLEEMAAQRGGGTSGALAEDEEAEKLKVQLRDALLDANESGKMSQVLETMAAESQLGDPSDVMKIKMQLKSILTEANDLGKMKDVLNQIIKETPPVEPSPEDEQILSELRTALLDANESGKLPEVLQEISSKKTTTTAAVAGSGSARPTSAKVGKAILAAAKTGQLAEVLDGMPDPTKGEATVAPVPAVAAVPVSPPDAKEVEVLRENVRAKMEQSIQNGVLEQGLVTLQRRKSRDVEGPGAPTAPNLTASNVVSPPLSPGTKAEQEDLKKLGQEICGVLQEASKSGKLDEALELLRQEQQEVITAAPQDEMDAVRKNLTSLMKDALLSGQLASALEELKTKSEGEISSTDIQAIKAKFKKLLSEALAKGTLASKVGMLKLIPKAPPSPPSGSPPDEMDVLKLHLREALQHAAEAGHLAEALASLRSGPAEGVQETMKELQNTLTEAALSGTLAETLRSLREAGPGFKDKDAKDKAAEEPVATVPGSPAAEAVESPEEKQLEDLRCRLRNVLSGAYDEGVLEEVVQQAIKAQAQSASELPALKAQVAQMRTESETLHSTVERLLREKEELERDNESLVERLGTSDRVTRG